MKRFTRRSLLSALAAVPFAGKALAKGATPKVATSGLPPPLSPKDRMVADAFVWGWLTLHGRNPEYRALVVRPSWMEMKEWAARTQAYLSTLGVVYTQSDNIFRFPFGAAIYVVVDSPDLRERICGMEFQAMYIEHGGVSERVVSCLRAYTAPSPRGYRHRFADTDIPARLLLGPTAAAGLPLAWQLKTDFYNIGLPGTRYREMTLKA